MKLFTLAALAMLAMTVQGQTNRVSESSLYLISAIDILSTNHNLTNTLSKWYGFTNWCDRIPSNEQEQAVKDLATGGVICRVMGHVFGEFVIKLTGEDGKTLDVTFDPKVFPSLARFRTCRICGKCKSKTEGDWR